MENQMEMFPGKGQIIQEMRDKVFREAGEKGCQCPVCDQFVKVYRRKITSTMASQLIGLYRMTQGGSDWVHTRNLVMGQSSIGDFSKLRFWGYIEEKPHETGAQGKKTSGYWKITPAGADFVKGRRKDLSHVLIYNNTPLTFEGDWVDIKTCLGDKFDYNELMGAGQ